MHRMAHISISPVHYKFMETTSKHSPIMVRSPQVTHGQAVGAYQAFTKRTTIHILL